MRVKLHEKMRVDSATTEVIDLLDVITLSNQDSKMRMVQLAIVQEHVDVLLNQAKQEILATNPQKMDGKVNQAAYQIGNGEHAFEYGHNKEMRALLTQMKALKKKMREGHKAGKEGEEAARYYPDRRIIEVFLSGFKNEREPEERAL